MVLCLPQQSGMVSTIELSTINELELSSSLLQGSRKVINALFFWFLEKEAENLMEKYLNKRPIALPSKNQLYLYPNMSERPASVFSLKNDIASIQTDPAFHDVTIVCSDGVEIGACRAILASRSPFFKAIFQKATSNKIAIQNIKSAALYAVLQFIHTENIGSTALPMAIDVYLAANFLLLPELIELVLERVHDNSDFEVAASLLNKATESLLWNENTRDLYQALLKPFCIHLLDVGDLNELSENALELLLIKSAGMPGFKTPEYDLLLCIIEWAWTRSATTHSVTERRAIFEAIDDMPAEPSAKILLGNGPRAALLKMMQHVDLSFICPHRLKSLTEAVDMLTDTSPQCLTYCRYACKYTKCSVRHPSEVRGKSTTFHWDQSIGSGLIFSEKDTVVESPVEPRYTLKSVRASAPCVADFYGHCEWDIVLESIGSGYCKNYHQVGLGLVSESFNRFEQFYVTDEWGLQYQGGVNATFSKGCGGTIIYYDFQQGDVISFYLDLSDGTCAILINGNNYGAILTNLPRNVNLYPAVSLTPKSKYRIKPYKY